MAPTLTLLHGGREFQPADAEASLTRVVQETAEQLERLALTLPASDVLAGTAARFAGCLRRRGEA